MEWCLFLIPQAPAVQLILPTTPQWNSLVLRHILLCAGIRLCSRTLPSPVPSSLWNTLEWQDFAAPGQ